MRVARDDHVKAVGSEIHGSEHVRNDTAPPLIGQSDFGILRIFVIGGIHVPWMGWALVGLGAISAAWGALISLLQGDLKRVLAYSSVENIGLILIAIGIALVAKGARLWTVMDLAMAAALYHSLTHGIFKSLLFLGAGTVDSVLHTREMDRMGGLLRKMPWTGAAFFVGSAAMCAFRCSAVLRANGCSIVPLSI